MEATHEQGKLVQFIATADRLLARRESLHRQLQTFSSESQADFASMSIMENAVLRVTLDKKPIGSIKYYERQLQNLNDVPQQLTD